MFYQQQCVEYMKISKYQPQKCNKKEDTDTNLPQPMLLKGSRINLQWFLQTIYYLRKYPTEDNIDRGLKLNKGWAQKNIGCNQKDSMS